MRNQVSISKSRVNIREKEQFLHANHVANCKVRVNFQRVAKQIHAKSINIHKLRVFFPAGRIIFPIVNPKIHVMIEKDLVTI